MSSYTVLAEVNERLRGLLWEAIDGDDAFDSIVSDEQKIAFTNPTQTFQQPDMRLSLWLYRIEENEFVKNTPVSRTANGGTGLELSFPPLSLDLTYLITPSAGSPQSDLLLLGKVMQVLYDNAVLPLSEPSEDVQEELRIVLARISLEELTRIWEALNEPYRLSVCYRVRVTRIRSDRRTRVRPVLDSRRGYRDSARQGAST